MKYTVLELRPSAGNERTKIGAKAIYRIRDEDGNIFKIPIITRSNNGDYSIDVITDDIDYKTKKQVVKTERISEEEMNDLIKRINDHYSCWNREAKKSYQDWIIRNEL